MGLCFSFSVLQSYLVSGFVVVNNYITTNLCLVKMSYSVTKTRENLRSQMYQHSLRLLDAGIFTRNNTGVYSKQIGQI